MGIIEVDMFEQDIDSVDHPEASRLKSLLEEVAMDFECKLDFFSVEKGIVSFSFDSDVLMAEIIKVLQNGRNDQH
ncbi:MAG: hypothetical protein C4582_10095 [Desulfobacteraceae bacterium]|jgi:hypothetical protein|nr:MAG: hypothetical protein C4582_10095 [Desulfobacteraceae bacterium]